MGPNRRFVLTVIGDDRAGLVQALSERVAAHGGNWEQSQLTELAGKFAGIVVVSVAADRADDLIASLRALDGLLEVSVHPGAESNAAPDGAPDGTTDPGRTLTIDLLGNDHPGIVREVSGVLTRHGLSIDAIDTGTREAPMAGGRLFEAHIVVRVPAGADDAAIRADLERLAAELMVDLDLKA